MAAEIYIFAICVSVAELLAFLVALCFVLRASKMHFQVALMWLFGFLQSATRLVAVIESKNEDFSTTWSSFALVLTFESCLGIEYWLFGLEFYLASIAIQEKLKG